MLIVLAGLPGTGKTALAQALAARPGFATLDKDRLRPVLLPGVDDEYHDADNDFVIGLALEAAAYLVRRKRGVKIVLDGRTFARRTQRLAVERFASERDLALLWVELVCAPEIARARIRASAGAHPAPDRNEDLYIRLRAAREPFEPGLRIDSGETSVEDAAAQVAELLGC